MPMRTLASLLFSASLVVLSPKPVVSAQATPADAASADAAQNLRTAEVAFARGRPDYVLARRALEQTEQTDDLLLQARANRLQARLDSAGRRYSRALPYYHKATALEVEAAEAKAAAAIAAADAKAAEAVRAQQTADAARTTAEETLADERAAARWKYITVIGICAAILAAGILGFLATVRKLRGDITRARDGQEASDNAFAEARTQLSESSRSAMKLLRRIYQTLAARIPLEGPGSAPNQLAAQNEAIGFLGQSSFDQGDTYEVAMEAFFEKYNATLVRLLNPHPGVTLRTESMPVRLPLDQAVPVALMYTELVGNALKHGGDTGEVIARLTKEGTSITLTVQDPSGASFSAKPAGEGRKLVAYLADTIGAKVSYPSGEETETRVRFQSIATRGGAAAIG